MKNYLYILFFTVAFLNATFADAKTDPKIYTGYLSVKCGKSDHLTGKQVTKVKDVCAQAYWHICNKKSPNQTIYYSKGKTLKNGGIECTQKSYNGYISVKCPNGKTWSTKTLVGGKKGFQNFCGAAWDQCDAPWYTSKYYYYNKGKTYLPKKAIRCKS